MRILQLTTGFIPQRGGIETVSSLLAREFHHLGLTSVVVTRTPDARSPSAGVIVVAAPSPFVVLREILRADAIVLHGIPVRLAWPLAVLRKPVLLIKHMWDDQHPSRLRKAIARGCRPLYVSRYMASLATGPADTIPNPYDATVFTLDPTAPRDRDLIFLGRVTREKGALDFVRLVATLATTRPTLQATLAGDGPALAEARALAAALGVAPRFRFTGALTPEQAATEFRQHRLFVFPALWDEPFGIVSLEAIACGCAVVAYASGGIPESVGPCGLTVPTGDLDALCSTTNRLLGNSSECAGLLASSPAHLAPHHAGNVARLYLDALLARSTKTAP